MEINQITVVYKIAASVDGLEVRRDGLTIATGIPMIEDARYTVDTLIEVGKSVLRSENAFSQGQKSENRFNHGCSVYPAIHD